MATFKLTADSVERRCPCPGPGDVNARGKPVRQRIYWDSDVPGFGLLAGLTAKSFIAQKDIGGRTVRVSIGRYPAWTADQARKRARELLVEMDKGIDPRARAREEAARQRQQEWQRFTLADAVEEHVARMRTKGCADGSVAMLRAELDRCLGDWMRRPLVEVTRRDCVDRHRKLTTGHGPVSANRAMAMLRAVYNSAGRLYEAMPPHPVVGVQFNPVPRRRSPIPWGDLPAWWAKVQALENPIRRDLQLALLFTGLRSTDARTIRWADIDFDAGTIHRPNPKGGAKAAFTVPLCAFVLAMLARRRLDNLRYFSSDQGWVFPTRDRAGGVTYIREPKEQPHARGPDGKPLVVYGTLRKVGVLPSPHRLRDTFATACREAGVGMFETKALMNHRLPSHDVTEGYQRPSAEHLRGCAEKVAAFLLARAKVDAEGREARANQASA